MVEAIAARNRIPSSGQGSIMLMNPMSRLDIADYLGVTIETVSRTISQLKAEGVVVRPGPIISRRWNGTFVTEGGYGPAV